MVSIVRHHVELVVLGLALATGALVQGQQPPGDVSPARLEGAWRQIDGGALVNVKGDQLFRFEKGTLSILGIVHRRPDALVLRNLGVLEVWRAVLKDRVLQLGHGEIKEFRQLKDVAPEVELRAVKLPPPGPVPPALVESIQKEIARRFTEEQVVLKDPAQAPRAKPLREENLRYLTKLVQEVGWLDTARFGEKTSVYATILLKHTGDLPLSIAALPYIERDLKLTGDGQSYAVLYDGVQLELGKKQRYGTQIGVDAQGNPYVLPLENPAKVDEYLKEMGVPPLSNYMADVSKYLYHGKPVRLATPEETE